MDQLQIIQLQRPGMGHIAGQIGIYQLVGLGRGHIGQHGDNAAAAQGKQGDDHVVVARQHTEIFTEQLGAVRHIGNVATGFFDAHDMGVFGQLGQHIQGDGAAGAARHIVEQDGDGNGVGHRLEMGQHAAFVGFVVIGRHHQQAVGPHGFIALGQSHGVGGVVGTCADDHRDTACHLLDDRLGDLVFFFLG